MKRDWEVVRKILLALENLEGAGSDLRSVEGVDDHVFIYHVDLLEKAGLIEGKVIKAMSGPVAAIAFRLTWEGHEFLDSIRPKPIWDKVKSDAKSKGIDLTFGAIKALAEMAIKAAIGG
ncbi:DUF2513 domain-containing protein [Dyella kyungheensis]|jgi:hypothetical protein|uniref:DUF2513 domain-containing protein n=1 Tax=Dyella kyungheensis TaxID=1242174 RepID=UPI003CF4DBBC